MGAPRVCSVSQLLWHCHMPCGALALGAVTHRGGHIGIARVSMEPPHPRAGVCSARAGPRHPRCHPNRSHKLSPSPHATGSTCFTGMPKLGAFGCCLVDALQPWGSRLDSVILGTVASNISPGVSEAACVPGSMGFAPFQAPSALPPAQASTSAAQPRDLIADAPLI